MIIAPHSDDEVIGCGGTVRKLVQRGAGVEVMIVTGGKSGVQEEGAETRKKEAQEAAKILGVNRLSFLDFDDGDIRPAARLKQELRDKIEGVRPDIVFAPNIFDNHPDHVIIGNQLVASANDCSVEFQCYFFEVWTPLVANVVVDISNEIEIKIQAMKAHQSQQAKTEFVEMIQSINRYRAIACLSGKPSMKYAEAFFRVCKKDMATLKPFLRQN
ncbi:MAG: PIG-L deacetylase family protein [Nitrospinales bacterium]